MPDIRQLMEIQRNVIPRPSRQSIRLPNLSRFHIIYRRGTRTPPRERRPNFDEVGFSQTAHTQAFGIPNLSSFKEDR